MSGAAAGCCRGEEEGRGKSQAGEPMRCRPVPEQDRGEGEEEQKTAVFLSEGSLPLTLPLSPR